MATSIQPRQSSPISRIRLLPSLSSNASINETGQGQDAGAQEQPSIQLRQSQGISIPSLELKRTLQNAIAHLYLIETWGAHHERLGWLFAGQTERHQDLAIERQELVYRLQQLFEAEPVEDGMTHPAEGLIERVLGQQRTAALAWLDELATRPDYEHRVALLRCLGRMPVMLAGDWGLSVMSRALRSEDMEVRDAAICALELWGTREAADILRAHHDPEPWLAEYVAAVLQSIA